MKTVIGLMDSKQEALKALQELSSNGFQRDAIQIMVNDKGKQELMSERGGYSLVEGAQTRHGFLSGGTDPLIGLGVLEEDAQFYAEAVNRGGYLLSVSANDDKADEAAAILRRNGAIDIDERAKSWRQEGWKGFPQREGLSTAAAKERESVIPVVEEQVQVGKRQVESGNVRVYSRIVETPVQEEIRLREEHAKVERRPVDRPASEMEREAFKERSFEIRETAEEPVVSKQARVKEEVIVGKETSERTEMVRDTVRRTEVEVEKAEAGRGKQVSAMDDDEFERHFRATYAGRGERFDESYRSAYLFAQSESATHPEFRGREWSAVEEDIHRDWERSHPGTWSKVQEAIHFGWDRTRRH